MADRAYRNGVQTQRRSPSPGAIATLALYYARQEAKAKLKAQGVKVQYVEAKDITAAGRALLAEHWQKYSERARALIKTNAQEWKR